MHIPIVALFISECANRKGRWLYGQGSQRLCYLVVAGFAIDPIDGIGIGCRAGVCDRAGRRDGGGFSLNETVDGNFGPGQRGSVIDLGFRW